MPRRVGLIATLAATLLCASTTARAQEYTPEPFVDDREVGVRLGLQGAILGVTPGGVRVGGLLLYRMSLFIWFDGEISATFGGSEPTCTPPGAAEPSCDPGVLAGFSLQALIGVRYYLRPQAGDFVPYLRGGIGPQLVRFGGDDDVTGFALPLWGGAGGRFRLGDGIAVGAEALLQAGPAFYNRNLGMEAYTAFVVQVGFEIAF